jgi:hypothetical protein
VVHGTRVAASAGCQGHSLTASRDAICATTRALSWSAFRADHPFELTEVDVTLDPELNRAYGERIPVLELDGEELFEFFVDEAELRRRIGR